MITSIIISLYDCATTCGHKMLFVPAFEKCPDEKHNSCEQSSNLTAHLLVTRAGTSTGLLPAIEINHPTLVGLL